MKILYIVTAYARHPGDVITPWLVELIQRLRLRGIEVEVLAPSYRGLETQQVGGVRVHRFRYAPRVWETLTHDQTAPDRIRERPWFLGLVPLYVVAGSVAAARLARTGDFDLIHVFWPLPHGVLGLAAKRAAGIPLVSTFFGVELSWMESQLSFLRPVLTRIVRGSDAVTAISSYTAARLARVTPGVAPAVIPFGAAVEPRVDLPPPPTADADRPFELLFVGRLVERKGVHLLLDALAEVSSSRTVTLQVVGDGPDRERLQAQAQQLGLAGRTVFYGFVPGEELERRLVSCDALVLPAVIDAKGDTEGLGVVLLEAMSYGKPVIASAAGGITDIVRDGRNGLLVPPGDAGALAEAVRNLRDHPEWSRRLGMRGREDVAERFSWQVIVDHLKALYAALV